MIGELILQKSKMAKMKNKYFMLTEEIADAGLQKRRKGLELLRQAVSLENKDWQHFCFRSL